MGSQLLTKGDTSASWWKGLLPQHLLFTCWGQLNKNSSPSPPICPSISDNPCSSPAPGQVWSQPEAKMPWRWAPAPNYSSTPTATKRTECPVLSHSLEKCQLPLNPPSHSPEFPCHPECCSQAKLHPKALMFHTRNLPWAESASFLESAQIMGTQSNAIKAQQLNKPAPVSWAPKPTSARAFIFSQKPIMGRAMQGKMLPSPLLCWAVHHPSAPCHLHISAGKSKAGSALTCLAGKKKRRGKNIRWVS